MSWVLLNGIVIYPVLSQGKLEASLIYVFILTIDKWIKSVTLFNPTLQFLSALWCILNRSVHCFDFMTATSLFWFTLSANTLCMVSSRAGQLFWKKLWTPTVCYQMVDKVSDLLVNIVVHLETKEMDIFSQELAREWIAVFYCSAAPKWPKVWLMQVWWNVSSLICGVMLACLLERWSRNCTSAALTPTHWIKSFSFMATPLQMWA